MENALLVLCPEDPRLKLKEGEDLQALLQSIQLIGEPDNGEMQFLAGERFLDLIALMGCSPQIRLEPEDKQPYCHVRLISGSASIEFHSGRHTHAPRCPNCRVAVSNWKSRINHWLDSEAESPWSCEACGHHAEPWNYNWRRSAGFGRCFIEISNIFPKEAKPQQQLLDTLNSHYGARWQYFYQY